MIILYQFQGVLRVDLYLILSNMTTFLEKPVIAIFEELIAIYLISEKDCNWYKKFKENGEIVSSCDSNFCELNREVEGMCENWICSSNEWRQLILDIIDDKNLALLNLRHNVHIIKDVCRIIMSGSYEIIHV